MGATKPEQAGECPRLSGQNPGSREHLDEPQALPTEPSGSVCLRGGGGRSAVEAGQALRGGFLSPKARAPGVTPALLSHVPPRFHLPLLLWLQGDSPGPVQKNLHNPIVQVGVPSRVFGPSRHPTRQGLHPVFPWGPWPLRFTPGHPRQRRVKAPRESHAGWCLNPSSAPESPLPRPLADLSAY